MFPPPSVLKHYADSLAGLRWQSVAGGFSGAEVWRGDDNFGKPVVALKAWPVGFPVERLKQIHRWMSQAERLAFVPTIVRTTRGDSFVVAANRLWDATTWKAGAPLSAPSENEVVAACAAVARLHTVWAERSRRAICPGVANRIHLLREWPTAPRFQIDSLDLSSNLKSLLHKASRLADTVAPAMLRDLSEWESKSLRVQPCVRDLRGEHVLFHDAVVVGIVDYGAMAEDSPAIDLARLLGDYSASNLEHFDIGLQSYRAAGGELDTPDEFVRMLSRTGTIGSVIMWLIHLGVERRSYPDTEAVEARIHSLIQRIEGFAPA